MGTVRRYVFPIVWMAIFAVIAMALFKLAFVDGMRAEASGQQPVAQLVTPSIPAARGTVTNVVQVQGAVANDPSVVVRSTAEGTVNFVHVAVGADVAKGDPLFQVQKLVEPESAQATELFAGRTADDGGTSDIGGSNETAGNAELEQVRQAATPAPVYTYTDVVATAAGKVTDLAVLVDQQVSVGTDAVTLSPGTFSVSGSLTSDQQFRLLDRPSTAMVTVTGGPAPFECQAVTVGEASSSDPAPQAPQDPAAMGPFGPAAPETSTGTVSCAVPEDVTVFAGLGASIDISAGTAEDVITVPTTAVKGAVDSGVVWVLENDGGAEPVEREVSLGLNDGQQVEIIEGLDEDELVLQFVPGAPADELMGPGMEDFGMVMGG
ncbi:efflux RND transporter periplasmic adaptor subunit [Crystallibacter degradans]|uniref:efflux RND transporter periplasmic adaptor subunit n=1 Tax=Crystallibacter degradans TaxID=2726743 RepID=UPI001472948E|nr:efflux RND transporter periplasmic adaptor subunit [Arthrobacter sp. SF27]NMR28379.1 efflux RND transporter periplasmic adaptor subunit [Arthrobacter sp. SF27]